MRRMSSKLRSSGELISAVILAAVVLGMSLALWSYAQSSTSQLKYQQQLQNSLLEAAMKVNLLKVYGDPSSGVSVYQLSYSPNSTVYAILLGIKGSSFFVDNQASLFIPKGGNSYVNLSDPSQWSSPPNIVDSSYNIMIQPVYSSDTNYYSFDLWVGFSNVALYKLSFSSLPYILLKVVPSNQYAEVLVLLLKIGDKYWAFSYYYL